MYKHHLHIQSRCIFSAQENLQDLFPHLARLAAIAKAEPDLREEIQQYVAALRSAPAPQRAPDLGAAAAR